MATFTAQADIPDAILKLGSRGEAEMRRILTGGLTDAGVLLTQAIEPITPVLTGALRRAIGFDVDAHAMELILGTFHDEAGVPVEYASFVEFGTRFMQGRHFFFPTAEASIPDAIREIEFAMEEGLRLLLGE